MSGRQWIRITPVENVPPREGRAVHIAGKEIAIFNLGDRFLAVDGRCPHQGGPLADGIIAGQTVVCPLHSWKVNLETGCVERPGNTSACLAVYPTRVEEGIVLLSLSPAASGDEGQAA